jgi:hypothetical protein
MAIDDTIQFSQGLWQKTISNLISEFYSFFDILNT